METLYYLYELYYCVHDVKYIVESDEHWGKTKLSIH